MTREEYEKLLKSDYWKGYSYSLIKERNFTCEDCGRWFPNERNKLQVHHLVYRDVNPWSYRPDEVIVLCDECHRKRHRIKEASNQNTNDTWHGYTNSSSNGSFSLNDRTNLDGNRNNPDYKYTVRCKRKFKLKYVLYLLLLAIILSYWDSFSNQNKKTEEKKTTEAFEKTTTHRSTRSEGMSKRATQPKPLDEASVTSSNKLINEDVIYKGGKYEEGNSEELSTLELLERRNQADVVKQARRAGVSTEGTTLEILERINHADVVKQAKRAGVSTERINHKDVVEQARRAGVSTGGTTLEILERTNHIDVVKQAKRAGVSTEGTTLEILERINHKDVVEQARRAGVSTEGTTLEILERINHADVVKQAKRAGVSTEGTTLEILERINRKELEKNNN